MTHVVGSSCSGCKTKECVEVCPADCFYEGPEQLYINPEECIDCEACLGVCPNRAIMAAEDLPPNLAVYLQINEENSMSGELPNVVKRERKEKLKI